MGVFVDGEDKGRAPVTVQNVKAGQHIVEGRKSKFKPAEQTVEVAPGENTVVQLKMELAPVEQETIPRLLRAKVRAASRRCATGTPARAAT